MICSEFMNACQCNRCCFARILVPCFDRTIEYNAIQMFDCVYDVDTSTCSLTTS